MAAPGQVMAQNIHSMAEMSSPSDFDMESHRRTYRRFITLFKVGSVVVALVLIYLFLTHHA
jgi:hypothetical protein